ncbi:MAG: hypothetical protein ACLFV5_00300 [Anaerolineales bacterium]
MSEKSDRKKPLLIIALLVALVASGIGALLALPEKRNTPPSTSKSSPLPTPPIDAQTPERTETASFALG